MRLDNALVVHKKSLYEIYVEEYRDSSVEAALKRGDPAAKQFIANRAIQQCALDSVVTTLQALNVKVTSFWRGDLNRIEGFDLVITVGGDGTVLDTAHKIWDQTPLLGINSHPETSAGVLCSGTADQTPTLIESIRSDSLTPIQATRLRVRVDDRVVLDPCLNDVLIAHPCPADLSRFQLVIRHPSGEATPIYGSVASVIKSSGIWVATATGSTGALRSAGGAALDPQVSDLQYWVREPYFHLRDTRQHLGGMIRHGDTLEVTCRTRRATIWGDGAHHNVALNYGQLVTLDAHPRPLMLFRKAY